MTIEDILEREQTTYLAMACEATEAIPKRRIALLPVSLELLSQALHLPEGTRIHNARLSDDARSVVLTVEHDSIFETRYGHKLPVVTVVFQTIDGKIVNAEYQTW